MLCDFHLWIDYTGNWNVTDSDNILLEQIGEFNLFLRHIFASIKAKEMRVFICFPYRYLQSI